MRGVELCDKTDGQTGDKTDGQSHEDAPGVHANAANHEALRAERPVRHRVERNQHQQCRDDQGILQCPFHLLFGGCTNERKSQQRGNDAYAVDEHGEEHDVDVRAAHGLVANGTDDQCSAGRLGNGTEQVGAHARDVTHVVTHVVGDNGRIARIIFGNTGFDLAHKVSTDVSGLRVDTTADATKESNGRTAKAEARQDLHVRLHRDTLEARQIGNAHPYKDETDDGKTRQTKAHNSTGLERDAERLGERYAGGRCRAHIADRCDAHANVSSSHRRCSTNDEGEGCLPAVAHRCGDQHGEQGHEDRKHAILALQECHGTFGNGRRDLRKT